MAKRKVEETVVKQNEIIETVSQPFWEKYQKQILMGLGAIVLVAFGWWGYKQGVIAPKQKEAVAAMWQAQAAFDRDSFQLALNSPGKDADGNDLQGFLGIINSYGGTPAANLSKYYAAICYLRSNDIDNAISYMEDFSADGDLLPIMKYGVLGDCYSEKKEFDKALGLYEKASNAGKNEMLAAVYLKKLAMLNEYQGNKEAAGKAYERLRRDYPNPNSQEWRDIEKYTSKASAQ